METQSLGRNVCIDLSGSRNGRLSKTDLANLAMLKETTFHERWGERAVYVKDSTKNSGAISTNCQRCSFKQEGGWEGVLEWHEALSHLSDKDQVRNRVLDGKCPETQGKDGQPNIFQLLQRCIDGKDLAAGRKLYCRIVEVGFEIDAFLGTHLIRMFAVSDHLPEASLIFHKLSKPNVFSWGAIILAHSKLGQNEQAINLYYQMLRSRVEPDSHIYVGVLKACASLAALDFGKQIHQQITRSGLDSDVFVCSTLIDTYAKCGSLEDARTLFDRFPNRNVVAWSALIAGYVQHRQGQEALQLFKQMEQENLEPNAVTFISILKACSDTSALEEGRQIHAHIIKSGYEKDLFLGSTLLDMYSKCGSLKDACLIFNKLPTQNVVTWNVLIAGHAQHRNGEEALQVFKQMQIQGVEPNRATFLCVLKACASVDSLQQGREFHNLAVQIGLESNSAVGNTIVDMYAKCGSLKDAHLVFDTLPRRDIVTWSVLIAGYGQHGNGREALELFHAMHKVGVQPDPVMFVSVLKVCSSIGALEQGRLIHVYVTESGCHSEAFVGSSLIDMYAKCGSLEDALAVFDSLPERDVVTWTTLITAYVQHGDGQGALKLFQEMQGTVLPNSLTFIWIVKACSAMAALEQGKEIHAHIVDSGLESDEFLGSALIDMYAKCGSLKDARAVFSSLRKSNVITWSALITGYTQHNDCASALQAFDDMEQAGIKPDDVAFLCLLLACSRGGLVERGCLHFKSMIEEHSLVPTVEHFNCIVDLLGHTGCWNEAEDLLETIPFGFNDVGWTSILSFCRTQGNVDLGRRCFDYVVAMDCGNVAAYVLMSNIYAHSGMHEKAVNVEELRKHSIISKEPASLY